MEKYCWMLSLLPVSLHTPHPLCCFTAARECNDPPHCAQVPCKGEQGTAPHDWMGPVWYTHGHTHTHIYTQWLTHSNTRLDSDYSLFSYA